MKNDNPLILFGGTMAGKDDSFMIDMVDTLKKTAEILTGIYNNYDNGVDEFINLPEYRDTAFTNHVSVVKNINGSDAVVDNPIIQTIKIDRHADGTQDIEVVNTVYPNVNIPITVESASEIEIMFSSDDDTDTPEDTEAEEE